MNQIRVTFIIRSSILLMNHIFTAVTLKLLSFVRIDIKLINCSIKCCEMEIILY